MNKFWKYGLHILLFFILMMNMMYLFDTFYKEINIILVVIGGTIGYSIVLITQDRKKSKNK